MKNGSLRPLFLWIVYTDNHLKSVAPYGSVKSVVVVFTSRGQQLPGPLDEGLSFFDNLMLTIFGADYRLATHH